MSETPTLCATCGQPAADDIHDWAHGGMDATHPFSPPPAPSPRCRAACRIKGEAFVWECSIGCPHAPSSHVSGSPGNLLVWDDAGTTINPLDIEVVRLADGSAPAPSPATTPACPICSHPWARHDAETGECGECRREWFSDHAAGHPGVCYQIPPGEPSTPSLATALTNLVNAARRAGFQRGRREPDEDANRRESAALDALKSVIRSHTPSRPA
jgi:hypothetical protein